MSFNRQMDKENVLLGCKEKNEAMKSAGKQVELGKSVLNEVFQI